MGTNAEFYLEAKKNGKWNLHRGSKLVNTSRVDVYEFWEFPEEEMAYSDQDYEVFASLVGVRDENNITPLIEPTGPPADPSEGLEKLLRQNGCYGNDGCDVFCITYICLDKFFDLPWDIELTLGGWVTPKEAEEVRKTGKEPPNGISHGNLDDSEFRKSQGLAYVTWKKTHRQVCERLLEGVRIQAEETGEPLENIRLVFWFE